jgi:hypothetical protein
MRVPGAVAGGKASAGFGVIALSKLPPVDFSGVSSEPDEAPVPGRSPSKLGPDDEDVMK